MVLLDLSAINTWATGTLANERAVYVKAPTLAFAGASTTTLASTVAISGAPVAGTNATITTKYALNVEAGDVLVASGTLYITDHNNAQLNANGLDRNGTLNVGTSLATGVTVAKNSTTAILAGGIEHHAHAVADTVYSTVAGDFEVDFTSISAGRTITVLQAGSATNNQFYEIHNHTSSVQTVTVAASSGNVNGASSATCTSVAWGACGVACDGTNCYITWSK
jgi:hypothetical protein